MLKRKILGSPCGPRRTKRYSTRDMMDTKSTSQTRTMSEELRNIPLPDSTEKHPNHDESDNDSLNDVDQLLDDALEESYKLNSKGPQKDAEGQSSIKHEVDAIVIKDTMNSQDNEDEDSVLREPTQFRDDINRVEDYTKIGSERRTGYGLDLSVMSYNVLSDLLMKRHMNLYNGIKEDDLEWDKRWSRIVSQVEKYHPDVLCLQEVQVDHWESHFVPSLSRLGYSGLYKQRTGEDKNDGCALFYRTSKLSLLSHHAVEFFQPNVRVLDRDNVAIVAKFQHQRSSPAQARPFVVATTHILFNKRRTDIKLSQLAVLFAELDTFARDTVSGQYVPVILTGDFNMTPDSPLVSDFVERGAINYREEILPKHSYRIDNISNLGITDRCQHVMGVSLLRNHQRPVVTYHLSREGARPQHTVIKQPANHQPSQTDIYQRMVEQQQHFDTGYLRHNFGFRSAYRNVPGREASSHQGGGQYWVVDYIFYSTVFSSRFNKNVEGRLKLVSKLRLPSERECRDMGGLPNPSCPSDHICLLARFALT